MLSKEECVYCIWVNEFFKRVFVGCGYSWIARDKVTASRGISCRTFLLNDVNKELVIGGE